MWDSRSPATQLGKDRLVPEVVLAQGGTQITSQQPNCAEVLCQSCLSLVWAVVSVQALELCIYNSNIVLKAPRHEVEAPFFSPSSATILHHSVNPLLLFVKLFSSSLQPICLQRSSLIQR